SPAPRPCGCGPALWDASSCVCLPKKRRSPLGSRARSRASQPGVPSEFRTNQIRRINTMALYENTIRLKGFLGRDAETKQTSNNPLIILSLATKSSYKDKQKDEWISRTDRHRIVCFAKNAKYAEGLKKGDYVEVTGTLRSSRYDGEVAIGKKKTTVNKRAWEVRATSVRKLARPDHPDAEPAPQGDAA